MWERRQHGIAQYLDGLDWFYSPRIYPNLTCLRAVSCATHDTALTPHLDIANLDILWSHLVCSMIIDGYAVNAGELDSYASGIL